MYIRKFDPWNSRLCTCPEKYSLNPYTGCEHRCIYCYSSSYIREFFNCRIKKNLIKYVKRDSERLPRNSLISLSNTSDPYPSLERYMNITRECLKIFRNYGFRVLIITKSDLVLRDLDILEEMRAGVAITITTMQHYRRLEPNAPSPERRILALKELSERGIPTILRLDPIFPYINENEICDIIERLRDYVRHVVSSTFKPRFDSWRRFREKFPREANLLREKYFKSKKIGNSWYLPKEMRLELMCRVRDICDLYGITFACCREDFFNLNNAKSCDGSHLI